MAPLKRTSRALAVSNWYAALQRKIPVILSEQMLPLALIGSAVLGRSLQRCLIGCTKLANTIQGLPTEPGC